MKNRQYSVSPNYIGKEAEIKSSDDNKGHEIRKHYLTNNPFVYNYDDHRKVLISDLFEEPSEYFNKINSYDMSFTKELTTLTNKETKYRNEQKSLP
ncbi:Transposase [Ligilactobacillus ruminis ATCC 27782]|uniref:Transposase n=1 Tax=Ligilactobacillus ruminis (strain ATCC 27782 / RF3) TaxID=1069534 RepID=G2SR57_LIGR2|nr:Transposase [Ligilactobacillus ruminis ATCC 27782]